jgi:hypothetical protein
MRRSGRSLSRAQLVQKQYLIPNADGGGASRPIFGCLVKGSPDQSPYSSNVKPNPTLDVHVNKKSWGPVYVKERLERLGALGVELRGPQLASAWARGGNSSSAPPLSRPLACPASDANDSFGNLQGAVSASRQCWRTGSSWTLEASGGRSRGGLSMMAFPSPGWPTTRSRSCYGSVRCSLMGVPPGPARGGVALTLCSRLAWPSAHDTYIPHVVSISITC